MNSAILETMHVHSPSNVVMELLGALYHHCSYERLAGTWANETSDNEELASNALALRSPFDASNPQNSVAWYLWGQKMVAIVAVVTMSITSTAPVLAQTPSMPRCTVCLRYGDQGDQVVYIQDQLKTLGFFAAKSTGYFGPLTETAVRQFQQSYGLAIDGMVGPQTQGRLEQIIYGGTATFASTSTPSRSIPSHSTLSRSTPPAPNPPTTARPSSSIRPGQIGTELYIGSEGAQVRDVQDLLQRSGFYQGRLTGYYGSLTTSAVEAFQRSQGMEPTGITGQKTLNALINVAP